MSPESNLRARLESKLAKGQAEFQRMQDQIQQAHQKFLSDSRACLSIIPSLPPLLSRHGIINIEAQDFGSQHHYWYEVELDSATFDSQRFIERLQEEFPPAPTSLGQNNNPQLQDILVPGHDQPVHPYFVRLQGTAAQLCWFTVIHRCLTICISIKCPNSTAYQFANAPIAEVNSAPLNARYWKPQAVAQPT